MRRHWATWGCRTPRGARGGRVALPGLAGRDPRPWLAVLDDLSDPAVLDGLWPWGAHGRVLVTTNRLDAALRAHSPRAVELGPFSDRESLAYLSTRLQADRDQWTGALDLAADLGFLPIALAQAGTLMAYTGIDCREYRTRMAELAPAPGRRERGLALGGGRHRRIGA